MERKREDFTHRGVKVHITYFLSPSATVPRFDVYATLSEGEEKIGASIEGWESESDALNAAKALACERIEKHLLDR
ncbi:hypothetical protein [Pseudomonas sp. LLC-1]|uniref:hypothetical protein n=1 Tax=Pseudomonas sp. LLC-1 TaxID=1812180 RepID=UPI0011B77F08|nr:hypothetical protein [Pseudomonas sp. LLC-1]